MHIVKGCGCTSRVSWYVSYNLPPTNEKERKGKEGFLGLEMSILCLGKGQLFWHGTRVHQDSDP